MLETNPNAATGTIAQVTRLWRKKSGLFFRVTCLIIGVFLARLNMFPTRFFNRISHYIHV
jgi:hypothetical protein